MILHFHFYVSRPLIFLRAFPVAYQYRIHLQCKRHGIDRWVRKILWKRKWQPTRVFLPRKRHGQRSLEGCSPGGHKTVGRVLGTKQQQQNLLRPILSTYFPFLIHYPKVPVIQNPDYKMHLPSKQSFQQNSGNFGNLQ